MTPARMQEVTNLIGQSLQCGRKPPKARTVSRELLDKTIETALSAIEGGLYQQSISLLTPVVDISEDWNCRFLLAGSYLFADMLTSARHQLVHIAERCPDNNLRYLSIRMLVIESRAQSACSQASDAEANRLNQLLEVLKSRCA